MCALYSDSEWSSVWAALIAHPRWTEAVQSVFFCYSVLDQHVATVSTSVEQHVCQICACAASATKHVFPSARALASHCRSMHGARSTIRTLIGDTTKCPVCFTVFSHRVQLIAHFSDSRRPKCRDKFLLSAKLILADLLAVLDERDRQARREAQRAGYSHALAKVPAFRANL